MVKYLIWTTVITGGASVMFAILAVIVAVAFATIFAGFFFRFLRKRDGRPISIEEVFVFLNRIYINDLLKLVDVLEEVYERQAHSRAEFGQVQAWRIAKMREHVRKMVANAEALHRFGYRHLKGDDATRKFLARRVVNYAVPVEMYGGAGILLLFVCRRFLFLDGVFIHVQLPILRHLVGDMLGAYEDLKEAALMLTRHAEPGVEVRLAARL